MKNLYSGMCDIAVRLVLVCVAQLWTTGNQV